MQRAITDRKHILQAGAAVIIHPDPVPACGAGRQQRLHGGHDADADDHHIGHDLPPIGERGELGVAGGGQTGQAGASDDLHPVRAMFGFIKSGKFRPGHARQHPIHRLDHCH